MTTVVNVVGARPQFIKAGPVSKALERAGIVEILLHTGQHYDPIMSAEIMEAVGLRDPDINLGVGSAGHGEQTARILQGTERVLMEEPVDAVLVYGDTNSTLAAALAAVKLGIRTCHVEAGLRSFNRQMPEEVNRVVADHLSDLLFAPTHTAMDNLGREGLASRSVMTGDVMLDALLSIDLDAVALPSWLGRPYYLATIHRAENTDDDTRLTAIVDSFKDLDQPVHLLAHPRLRKRIDDLRLREGGSLRFEAPLQYAVMLAALRSSEGLFTDSGGLQKEAYMLQTPCVTIRNETEWPETLDGGWNVLSQPGAPLGDLVHREIADSQPATFGDGSAAPRIVAALANG